MRELVIVMAKILLVLAKNDLLSWRSAYNYSIETSELKGVTPDTMKQLADNVKYFGPKINEMQDLVTELEIRLRDAGEK